MGIKLAFNRKDGDGIEVDGHHINANLCAKLRHASSHGEFLIMLVRGLKIGMNEARRITQLLLEAHDDDKATRN